MELIVVVHYKLLKSGVICALRVIRKWNVGQQLAEAPFANCQQSVTALL